MKKLFALLALQVRRKKAFQRDARAGQSRSEVRRDRNHLFPVEGWLLQLSCRDGRGFRPPCRASSTKNLKKISLTFYFLQLYCPNGISPMGNLGCFPRGKPAATESRYPAYDACLGGRASDWHAADTGSVSWCGKGFLSTPRVRLLRTCILFSFRACLVDKHKQQKPCAGE